jgi:hypothetical protein
MTRSDLDDPFASGHILQFGVNAYNSAMNSPNALERYANLIESMIPISPVAPLVESRAIHRPLVIYSRLLGMEASGQIDDGICDSIETLDDGVWSSLVLRVAGEVFGKPLWIEKSGLRFEALVHQQQPNGAFLPPDSRMNPETRWYEELTILHAVASYAVRVTSSAMQSAVAKSAAFHLNETQPDHATAEPWGLLAFAEYAPMLADQVLHAMSMQYPQGVTGAPLLLLGDVLYGLRRLMRNLHDSPS